MWAPHRSMATAAALIVPALHHAWRFTTVVLEPRGDTAIWAIAVPALCELELAWRSPRAHVCLPVRCRPAGTPEWVATFTLDASVTGLRLVYPGELAVGTAVLLEVSCNCGARPTAHLVRVDPHPERCHVTDAAHFPLAPPIPPMLAKTAATVPGGEGWLYEPKWDGFRAIVFRGGGDVFIQSRDSRPLDRYFPELHDALIDLLPDGCVLDGEIVIMTPGGLDFDLLQLRLHPAASRVAKLAAATPSSFVAFDLLAVDGVDHLATPQHERRHLLERLLHDARPPLYITPITPDHDLASTWLDEFEGAGLDGVIAKAADAPYQPGKRAMVKIKHIRTADCVVAGFRWYKTGRDAVGSLLLGLHDSDGVLQHVGVTSSFTMAKRRQLVAELEPLREGALDHHPWREWAGTQAESTRMPGGQSRWSAGKDLSWEPLRIERVCEVKYDHLQGNRFRHAATFLRWRPDRRPDECRYDQLDVTPTYRLEDIFGGT
jgi:ATP-dependent DNA ligase